MSKHGTALTVGQFAEFASAVIKALPRDIAPEDVLFWANNGEQLSRMLCRLPWFSHPQGHDTKPGIQIKTPSSDLLVALSTVEVPAVAHFVARDKFTTLNTPDGVKLYWVNDSFRQNFLRKVEYDVPACMLQKSRLRDDAIDNQILDELGLRVATSLAHLWELLKRQPKGEKGTLLVNSLVNICYLEDEGGHLWAMGSL